MNKAYSNILHVYIVIQETACYGVFSQISVLQISLLTALDPFEMAWHNIA